VLIQKVGKAQKTELVNSSLPAWLRKVDVAASLLSHLLTSGEKSMTLGFVNPNGNPKYVKGSLPFFTVESSCKVLKPVLLNIDGHHD